MRDRLRHGRDGQHEASLAWLIAGAIRWYQHDQQMSALPDHLEPTITAWSRELFGA